MTGLQAAGFLGQSGERMLPFVGFFHELAVLVQDSPMLLL